MSARVSRRRFLGAAGLVGASGAVAAAAGMSPPVFEAHAVGTARQEQAGM